MNNLTFLQKNFIRYAVEAYDLEILGGIFGVPDTVDSVPEWSRNEVLDLLRMLEEEDV